MIIRPATASDLADLQELSIATFTDTFGHLYKPEDLAAFIGETYSLAALGALLEDPAYRFWLVTEENCPPAGYVLAGRCGLPHEDVRKEDGEVKRLYIRRDYQGRGYGEQLMATAMQWLESDGPRTIWLGVWSENSGAQRLYQRFGFAKVGEYGFKVGGHYDHEFIFRRPKHAE